MHPVVHGGGILHIVSDASVDEGMADGICNIVIEESGKIGNGLFLLLTG